MVKRIFTFPSRLLLRIACCTSCSAKFIKTRKQSKPWFQTPTGTPWRSRKPATAPKVGYDKNIDRICFIVGNHHTPSKIDGLDFQIQWEADLLENLTIMDKEKEQEKIKKCIDDNFKTVTGKKIAYERLILG